LGLLIGERAHPAVRKQRPVAELREIQRVVAVEPLAGQVTGRELVLQGVALIAHGERAIFVERRKRCHPDIGGRVDAARQRQRHVPAARPVTGFAVHRQRREARLVRPSARIEGDGDLAAVAPLAVREARHVAEDAHWRPVAAVGQRQIARDRDPAAIRP